MAGFAAACGIVYGRCGNAQNGDYVLFFNWECRPLGRGGLLTPEGEDGDYRAALL